MILNLKQLNEYIVYHHFKMDGLQAAVELMKPGCFMASIDLKYAFYSVPVHRAFQKYLKFKFKGMLYQYTCLPNGLSSAPCLFTKLMKPVCAELRKHGHTNLGYIDDSLLLGDTTAECHNNVQATEGLMGSLGFIPHQEKSVFSPKQKTVFLGFILNSTFMTITPTCDKITKTKQFCLALLNSKAPTIQELAEVIGILVANFPGVEFGLLHYRSLQKDKVQALVASKGNYLGHVQLSRKSITDLNWWVENIAFSHKHIIHDQPSATIQSDASKLGWGAAFAEQSISGRWSTKEETQHMNVLELRAVLFGLISFCSHMSDIHVELELDNTTAVAYINNMGGSKSDELNQLSQELWDWCINHNIWVTAVHIPGAYNMLLRTDNLENSKTNMSGRLAKQLFKRFTINTQTLMLTYLQVDLITNW